MGHLREKVNEILKKMKFRRDDPEVHGKKDFSISKVLYAFPKTLGISCFV